MTNCWPTRPIVCHQRVRINHYRRQDRGSVLSSCCKEVWAGLHGSPVAFALGDLAVAWSVPVACTVTWRTAAAPLHVARLEMSRVGWTIKPGQLVGFMGAQGIAFHMGNTSPALIAIMFSEELQRRRLVVLSAAIARHGPVDWASRSVNIDFQRRAAPIASAARALQAGALWTPARLAKVGCEIPAGCPMCGTEEAPGPPDSRFHRLWVCPAVET